MNNLTTKLYPRHTSVTSQVSYGREHPLGCPYWQWQNSDCRASYAALVGPLSRPEGGNIFFRVYLENPTTLLKDTPDDNMICSNAYGFVLNVGGVHCSDEGSGTRENDGLEQTHLSQRSQTLSLSLSSSFSLLSFAQFFACLTCCYEFSIYLQVCWASELWSSQATPVQTA
jgi:hypothetical protein